MLSIRSKECTIVFSNSISFSIWHSWLCSPCSQMWIWWHNSPFVQPLPSWALLILPSAFISQCWREQRLLSQLGCIISVLSHSLQVARQSGQSLWSMQVTVAEGKVSPAKNKLATKTLPFHFYHISLAKASHMTEPDSHRAGKSNPHSESGRKTDTSGEYHLLQAFLLSSDFLLSPAL